MSPLKRLCTGALLTGYKTQFSIMKLNSFITGMKTKQMRWSIIAQYRGFVTVIFEGVFRRKTIFRVRAPLHHAEYHYVKITASLKKSITITT